MADQNGRIGLMLALVVCVTCAAWTEREIKLPTSPDYEGITFYIVAWRKAGTHYQVVLRSEKDGETKGSTQHSVDCQSRLVRFEAAGPSPDQLVGIGERFTGWVTPRPNEHYLLDVFPVLCSGAQSEAPHPTPLVMRIAQS